MMLQTMLNSISRRSALSAAIVASLLVSASAVQAQTVTYTNTLLGTGNSGTTGNIVSGDQTLLTGINDSGAVIGSVYTDPSTLRHPTSSQTRNGVVLNGDTAYGFGLTALSSSGTFSWAMPTTGESNTGGIMNFSLNGTNSAGQVVGTESIGPAPVSFLTNSVNMTSATNVYPGTFSGATQVLDTNDSANLIATYANGINDHGLVVGSSTFGDQPGNIGMIYNSSSSSVDNIAAGTYVDVNVHSATGGETSFNAVNNAGIAVGFDTTSSSGLDQGLIYQINGASGGSVLDEFTIAGSTNTVVTGINLGAAGTPLAGQDEIVGWYTSSSNNQQYGFTAIWNGTNLTFLNTSINGTGVLADSTWLTGINDKGVITGYSSNSGSYAGFVGTPNASAVPLPSSFWLMASTLAGFGFRLRRNKA